MHIEKRSPLSQDEWLLSAVAEKDRLLETVVDGTTTASWDLAKDEKGRPILLLDLRDQSRGEAQARFAPDELANEAHLSARLSSLKGALQRVSGWNKELEKLYADIRSWLTVWQPPPYITEETKVVVEEPSGPYHVPMLRIERGDKSMAVEPIACWVVGADGSLDLQGPGGPMTLLLMKQDGGWFWVDDRRPYKLQPLTPELFRDLAEACME
jgi:hypothetical protein